MDLGSYVPRGCYFKKRGHVLEDNSSVKGLCQCDLKHPNIKVYQISEHFCTVACRKENFTEL